MLVPVRSPPNSAGPARCPAIAWARRAYIDAAHRVRARLEDDRTGKACGIRRLPSQTSAMSRAWLSGALIAATLLARLRPITTLQDRRRATRTDHACASTPPAGPRGRGRI
jgi:hypothetical protein